MSLLRSDIQVALNTLHVAIQESADIYKFVAAQSENSQVASVCADIAEARNSLAAELAGVIRETGDLPGEPDRDRETALEIRERISTLFEDDEILSVIEHRQQGELDLLTLLDDESIAVLKAAHQSLLDRCRRNVDEALAQLSVI